MLRNLFKAAALAALLAASPARSDERSLNILFISSFGMGIPAQKAMEAGLDRVLHYKSGAHSIYYEFLDAPRLPLDQSKAALARALPLKYQGKSWDMVVSWAPAASRFVIENRHVFGDAPRIHVETGADVVDGGASRDTALTIPNDYSTSLRRAVEIARPKRILVIGEAEQPTAQVRLNNFKDAASKLHPQLPIEYRLDEKVSDLKAELAHLDADVLVYYLLMFSNGEGTRMTPYAVVRELAQASAAPVFSQWESLMGSGIAGGHVFSHEMIGAEVGSIALSLLGEQQPASKLYFRDVYDEQALERWNIDLSRLPPDAILINQNQDVWTKYRTEILTAAAAVAVLSAFSLALLRSLSARNRALAALDQERRGLADRVLERTRELDALTQDLSRSNQELESFAYAVSHDLRSPVRTMSAYSKLLTRALGNDLDGDSRDYLNFISQGAAQMDHMIVGLLDYSRVGHQSRESFEPFQCRTALQEALDLLAESIKAADAEIKIDIPDDLPAIHGNSATISRLFQNLLENALKYRRPDIRPRITISARVQDGWIHCETTDNGIGIPEDQRLRAFALFHRLGGSVGADGQGIGLALCRRIVQSHGGEIWIEESESGGCRFCFTLPAA